MRSVETGFDVGDEDGTELGDDVGDDVGDAVLNTTYSVFTDCQSLLSLLVCNRVSNAPDAMDSFNACTNIAVA